MTEHHSKDEVVDYNIEYIKSWYSSPEVSGKLDASHKATICIMWKSGIKTENLEKHTSGRICGRRNKIAHQQQ